MVFFESIALLGGLKDVFLYNRDLYMFNRQINQERIYHTQKMRIDQILLYRDDLRTLFELTVGKMENYLVVNTLTLAFTLALFYAGKMPIDTPSWLMWLWGACLATAVLFLIMSVWFAIYATITAQTLAVRLLTQWLRLPVPSQSDIAKASATAEEFEKQPRDALLRVPLVSKGSQSSAATRSYRRHSDPSVVQSTVSGEMRDRGPDESESYPAMVNPVLEDLFAKRYSTFVEHFHLFRYLQENWAGYDAYARICVVIGTTQLLNSISYMAMAWFISHNSRWGGSVFTVLVIVFSILHARMNVLLSKKEFFALSTLLTIGPLLSLASIILHYMNANDVYSELISIFTPISFAIQIGTMAFYLGAASEENGALPTKYTTVVSIDVLGLWEGARPLQENDDDESLRWDERAFGVLTGWQARWLRATKREAPVAALIPTSVDITAAERERYLTVNREVIGGKHRFVPGGNLDIPTEPAGETGLLKHHTFIRPQREKNLPESTHMRTLPWTSFRQVSGVVILVWVAGLAISIAVAVRGDIPGWKSNPGTTPLSVAGFAMWTPSTQVHVHSIARSANIPTSEAIVPLLGGATFSSLSDRRSPRANVRSIRAVTPEGVHVVVTGNQRYLLTKDQQLYPYTDFPEMADFFDSSIRPNSTNSVHPVPWCLPSDHVTMVTHGEMRDCSDFSKLWYEGDPHTLITHYRAISGKFALHNTDRHVHKLAFYHETRTVRIEARISVPHVLERIVDIARNEEVVAILSSDGLVALWSYHHNSEFPSKGIREMPNRKKIVWKNIVGAGGKAFVVFGEDKTTAANEAWYVHNILDLDRLDILNHSG
jgi:hypothetical protein